MATESHTPQPHDLSTPLGKSQRELEQYARLLEEANRIQGVSLGRDAWRRLRRNYAAMASLCFLCLVSTLALFTPLLPLQSPIEQDPVGRRFKSPAEAAAVARDGSPISLHLAGLEGETYRQRFEELFYHRNWFDHQLVSARLRVFGDWCIASLCGTDELGRDVLARLFWGARVSLIVGLVATFVSLVIGVSYGATAGYLGGRIDNFMMRLVDMLYSIPFIFIVIFLITILNERIDQATARQAMGSTASRFSISSSGRSIG